MIQKLLIITICFLQVCYTQTVNVKDSDDHTLIQINDEGDNGGSITLPDASSVSTPDDKLYNVAGELRWDGRLLDDCEITQAEFDALMSDYDALELRVVELEVGLTGNPICYECQDDCNCGGPSDRCITLDDGKYCATECVTSDDCPPGYGCTDIGDGTLQCIPYTNSCTCLGDDLSKTRICENSNVYGTCYGTQECTPVGWGPCNANDPAEEICDGIDNDCDGTIDEGCDCVSLWNCVCSNYQTSGSCGSTGFCYWTGTACEPDWGAINCAQYTGDPDGCNANLPCVYVSGNCEKKPDTPCGTLSESDCAQCELCEWTGDQCSAVVPSEICDGIDNDCDGFIDEGCF